MKYLLYILRCSGDSLYVGITNDLENRIKIHNAGKGAKYTRTRLPVSLVYIEECVNHREASQRELQIKGWNKAKKENLIKYGNPII